MADFLTRLIQRSRGLSPNEQSRPKVEPLIAPLYASGRNAALSNDILEEEQFPQAELKSRMQTSVRHPNEAFSRRQGDEHASFMPPQSDEITSRDAFKIEPAGGMPDELLDTVPNPAPKITPLAQPTPMTAAPSERKTSVEIASEKNRQTDQAPLVIRPQSITLAKDAGSRQVEVEKENAAPVVRVTIGRIEVRAVNAPAPPARRATPPTPKLSLEDYLLSRNGRKG